MTYLSSNQLKQYEDEGFVSPINIFSKDKAKEIRNEIELIEKEIPGELDKSGRYNAHLISPLLDEVTHNPKILDAVESLIVKNILVDVGDMVQEGTPFVQIEFEDDKKSNIEETNKTKTQIEEIQIPAEKEDIDINKNEIVLVKPLIPDLGDVEEVEVIEICVEVGQNIEINDSIMILETDKAAMEIPASVEGKITKLNISLGDMVKAGMPFVEIESSVVVSKSLNKINEHED